MSERCYWTTPGGGGGGGGGAVLAADGARTQRTVHLPAQRVSSAGLHLFQGEEIFYLLGKSGDAGTTCRA